MDPGSEPIINPVADPAGAATEENAAANMALFAEDLAQFEVVVTGISRDPASDHGDGRCDFTLRTADGRNDQDRDIGRPGRSRSLGQPLLAAVVPSSGAAA
jgi:hypothetical protein